MTSIVVMNAKGGVGKSTLTMALAETLAVYHRKKILLIDADGQMSLTLMVMSVDQGTELRKSGRSLGGFLNSSLPGCANVEWSSLVSSGVGDLDDATTLHILAGDMELPLIERQFAERKELGRLRQSCRLLLAEAQKYVDFVLIDCAPGISVMTECWLREAAWHLVPVKPDILAVSGMQYLKAFKKRDPGLGFARHLGVVINMKDMRSEMDGMIHDMLRTNPELQCFQSAVPLIAHIQKAALFNRERRSYLNKYPGAAGSALRALTEEVLQRCQGGTNQLPHQK